jgi:hypothetical protein
VGLVAIPRCLEDGCARPYVVRRQVAFRDSDRTAIRLDCHPVSDRRRILVLALGQDAASRIHGLGLGRLDADIIGLGDSRPRSRVGRCGLDRLQARLGHHLLEDARRGAHAVCVTVSVTMIGSDPLDLGGRTDGTHIARVRPH